MATLEYRDLSFEKEKDFVRVFLYRWYYFDVSLDELSKIGKFSVLEHSITFLGISDKKANHKFNIILEKGFGNLKNKYGKKKTYYVHRNSGIPLIGTNYFGLIDRDTNVIEVKPMTGCNFNCNYCSVDEGVISRRIVDYVVEEEYLFSEFKKLVEIKNVENIDAHLNAQGETTMYAQLIQLVKDISSLSQVKTISIDTNGSYLTKELIDDLAEAGLTRVNLSLNAIDPKVAVKIAGAKIDVPKIMDMARYIVTKMDLVIAPTYLHGLNDNELPKIAKFATSIGAGRHCPPLGIQNFLYYSRGRNPVKQVEFDDFFKKMKELEKSSGEKLLYTEGFGIFDCKKLKKPFKRGQVVTVDILMPGRFPGEMIGKSGDRLVSIFNCSQEKGKVKVKIKRTKHNIFNGELLV